MADDIVIRLRHMHYDDVEALMREAADNIEELRREVDLKGYRLDDAIEEIRNLMAAKTAIKAAHSAISMGMWQTAAAIIEENLH